MKKWRESKSYKKMKRLEHELGEWRRDHERRALELCVHEMSCLETILEDKMAELLPLLRDMFMRMKRLCHRILETEFNYYTETRRREMKLWE